MIRKLRWKFVAVCMGLVALVLSAVFGAAYHAVRQNIEDLSRQMLYQVLREDSGRGAVPNPTIEIGGDRVLLPYFKVPEVLLMVSKLALSSFSSLPWLQLAI